MKLQQKNAEKNKNNHLRISANPIAIGSAGNKKWTAFSIIIASIVIITFISHNEPAPVPESEYDNAGDAVDTDSVLQKIAEPEPPPENFYIREGYVRTSGKTLQWERDIIRKNQPLSEILFNYNVSPASIHELSSIAKNVFDVRKLLYGNHYNIFYSTDSTGSPVAECFIYEINAAEFVVYQLSDSISVMTGKKEVEVKTKKSSGIINSSLWNAMTDNGLDFALAIELAEIFAWTIDFYRIQKGDGFNVIYEEKYVDGEYAGIGNIQAACFTHYGKEHYAIWLNYGESGDYFDRDAKSLRKAFLKAPLKFSRITSGYTMKRFHPVQKRYKPHLGVDYAAPAGTPIMTTGDGTVSEAGFTGGNGNYVKVRHNSVFSTQYLHLSRIHKGMYKGKRVRQGDVIGYVGSTGLSTGPHVCYRFWKDGKQINPMKLKMPPSEPVGAKYLEEFNLIKDELIGKLKGSERNVNDSGKFLNQTSNAL